MPAITDLLPPETTLAPGRFKHSTEKEMNKYSGARQTVKNKYTKWGCKYFLVKH